MKKTVFFTAFFMAVGCFGVSYTLSDESVAVWVGKKVGGEHTGTVKFSQGLVEFQGEDLVGGSFTIDMTSISATDVQGSSKENLDNHLKSGDFFDVASNTNNRQAKFEITKVEKKEGSNYTVVGNLTIKGVTREESFEVVVTREGGDVVKGKGKLVFDRTRYDIRYRSGNFFKDLGDKLIYNDVELEFDIVARRGGEEKSG